MLSSKQIRQSFLEFFKEKGHRIVESSPVIPHNDPTLLFTNAGMNQFKDVFLGIGKRDYTRAVDTQKCIRVSGKHNDLEEVGLDTYHHTFFEMLGNWSFGDYYKKEAIKWAWELLTEVWKLDKNRLHATVFRTDDEAYEIWTKYLPIERIHRFDEKDNFWEMGETGPCGPCSEIHYDRTPDLRGGNLVNAGLPEVIEIWNLVFIQYNRKIDGSLEELPSKHVDTGMGFERIVSVIQNTESNYDTDVFIPLIRKIEEISGKKYSKTLNDPIGIAMRVIADHIRTLSFAIADGAYPGNTGRGYVLRRILRRASRFSRNLGIKEEFLYTLVPTLIETMTDIFPELEKNQKTIIKFIKAEEHSFLQTLDRGLEIFNNIIVKLKQEKSSIINGQDAFMLYDTYGFPLDLTELMAKEMNLSVDTKEFEKHMSAQQERSRNSRKVSSQEVETLNLDFKTIFTGYNSFEENAKVLWVKENQIVTDKTPFYSESGGQISDTGYIILGGEEYSVENVKKINNAIVHICNKEIEPLIGQIAHLKVDIIRRRKIMRNHSATHLLHEALFQILGSHVKQAGSLVSPDYLRFDFNHYEKVTQKDLRRIEEIVNEKIYESIDVDIKEMDLTEAQKNTKIKMFFGDKYGDRVRVVTMDKNYSMELCGGTHVKNTSEIGIFKIISESSIAAGIRRIEAITGDAVYNYIYDLLEQIDINKNKIDELNERMKQIEKDLKNIKFNDISEKISEWIKNSKVINGIKIVNQKIEAETLDELRDISQKLRDLLGKNGIGLLATELNGKAQLCCVVTDDLKAKLPAGKLVGQAAKLIGGGGGGKPHLATAGGKDINKIDELFKQFPKIIEENL